MSERKLGSIQKIYNVNDIINADKIQVVNVLGWECVVQKDEFKIGDLVVYVEPDSILPEKPEFEFLRSKKFRIKTIRLKKQVSQGICFPLSILPKGKYKEGDDVTDIIDIKKYDPELSKETRMFEDSKSKNPIIKYLMKYKWYRKLFVTRVKKGWPNFMVKTDEHRIQVVNFVLQNCKDVKLTATEKLDGQSASYGLLRLKRKWYQVEDKFQYFVCSRNIHLKTKHECNYWKIADKYDIKNVLMDVIGEQDFVYIQGEIIGPGIQKNKYKLKEIDFRIFNLIYSYEKISYDIMMPVIDFNEMKAVPLVSEDFKLKDSIKECIELAKGKSKLADIEREGIVVRNEEKNISFKIINPNFILKHQDEDEDEN